MDHTRLTQASRGGSPLGFAQTARPQTSASDHGRYRETSDPSGKGTEVVLNQNCSLIPA